MSRLRLGIILLALIAAGAAAEPWIAAWRGIDPLAIGFGGAEPPSLAHPLGTDELGRDLLQRVLAGGRVSLAVGLAGAASAVALGALIGLAAGWRGGWLDAALMRLADLVLAVPATPLMIVLAAADLSRIGLDDPATRIAALIALVGWPGAARLARAQALSVRERPYVLAARAYGAGGLRIMLVHLLPNVAGPLIVAAALGVAGAIQAEAVLSFLGLGVQPPDPSWGALLAGAQETLLSQPWLALGPAAAILAAALAVNLVGDGLRARFDSGLS